jgi:heat shock protein HtpX
MGLVARMMLTIFLLGLVYVVFAFVLRAFLGISWIALAFIALVIAGVQFFFADKIALASMSARMVTPEQAPDLYEIIGRLAAQTNLPMPRVAIINSSMPNAFATGRSKRHAVVAVTTGLYSQLSPAELEAVLAHELTHIINHDMLVMTVATFFSMVASMLVQNLLWFGGGFYGGRRRDGGGDIAIVLLVSAVVYAVSFMLIRALSRYRELLADRGSALITGAPEHLATALQRISGTIARIPQRDIRQAEAVSALFIVPAIRGDSLQGLLSTHPSLQDRLAQLQRIQQEMEQAHS